MVNLSLDPQEWANWLQEIQENPEHHQFIAKDKGVFHFLDKKQINSGKKALDSSEILKISKFMLEEDLSLSLLDKHKITNGMHYLITKREARFERLGLFYKFFAWLRGIDTSIQAEKVKIKSLQTKIDLNINKSHETKFQFLEQQVKDLEQRKLRGDFNSLEKRTKLNEKLFQCAKDLHELKQSATEAQLEEIKQVRNQLHKVNPHLPKISNLVKIFGPGTLKSSLRETVSSLCDLYQLDKKNLARDCRLFSCDPTEMQAIYVQRMSKVYGTGFNLSTVSAIEKNWQDMITNKQEKAVEKKIGEHYVVFIPSSTTEEGEIYIKEKLVDTGSYKAVFLATSFFNAKKAEDRKAIAILQPLDAVQEQVEEAEKQAEQEEKERTTSKSSSQSSEVVKTGTEKSSSLEMKDSRTEIIDRGVKTPFFKGDTGKAETSFFKVDTGKAETSFFKVDTGKVETSFSKGDAGEVRKPAFLKDNLAFEKFSRKPIEVDTEQTQISETEVAKQEKEEERKTYRKEAQMCLELRDLGLGLDEGIWPTHKVTEINGEITIIQEAAGYKVQGSKKDIAINMGEMLNLAVEEKLNIQDQIVYLRMIGDFLRGVKRLHELNIIHRDLKPENILCSPDGHGGVSDFGIACRETIVNDQDEVVPDPAKEMCIGTPFYIAPEIAYLRDVTTDWEKKISKQADIWSSGIILWQLFSGNISQHPAINNIKNPTIAMSSLMNLAASPLLQANYNNRFPKPRNEDSLLYAIWSCGRVDSAKRPTISELSTKYEQWANQVQQKLEKGDIKSIDDAFAKEWDDYQAFIKSNLVQNPPTAKKA